MKANIGVQKPAPVMTDTGQPLRSRIQRRKSLATIQDEFITIASHQLRTPATCVKQYLALILEGYAGEISPAVKNFIQIAYDNNERQLNTLSVLLRIATLDSGQYQLMRVEKDACAILESVINDFKPLLEMRDQHLTYVPPVNCKLLVDSDVMHIAIGNLIENASLYSPPGSVIVVRTERNETFFKVMVEDHGVGLKKTDVTAIFKKFRRINNDLSDTVTGNGLGLYVTKRIVEMHDATLTVQSKPRKGSTFVITFAI